MNTDLYRQASEEFGRRVKSVARNQWHLPTPCTEWDVRAIVDHITRMNVMVPRLLRGDAWADIVSQMPDDILGSDPARSWERSAPPASAAFDSPSASEAIVHLPQRDIPAAQFLVFRTNDTLVHAWDLARAISVDDQLDPEVVKDCYQHLKPAADMLAASGLFAPRVILSQPAPSQQAEFLALQGRNPL